jgi:hypothetical protein
MPFWAGQRSHVSHELGQAHANLLVDETHARWPFEVLTAKRLIRMKLDRDATIL